MPPTPPISPSCAAPAPACVPEDRTPTDRTQSRTAATSLTPTQQAVLNCLAAAGRPLGAYDVLESLNRTSARCRQPPTVYRALDALVGSGLVRRLESRKAFQICAHPGTPHDCLFLICTGCGRSEELVEPRIPALLDAAAATLGFQPQRRVVEVEGICRHCRATEIAAPSPSPRAVG